MKKKVRCENCDAVIEAEENRFYMSGWHSHFRCYHCNSVETSEPYRLPKWERSSELIGTQITRKEGKHVMDKS